VETEREARSIVEQRIQDAKSEAQSKKKVSLEDIFERAKAGEARALQLIVKADVQGSLDPVVSELNKLSGGEIGINILYAETGNIGENDIMLASGLSRLIVIGFNVQADVAADRWPKKEGVSIRLYEIIYRMTEDIESLKGMLEPVVVEKVIGRAQVLAVFSASKLGKVAGCKVTDGELRRNARVRLFRGSDMLFEGEMASLRHEKEDVREMRLGFECGVGFKNFKDIQVGDQLICYVLEKRNLNSRGRVKNRQVDPSIHRNWITTSEHTPPTMPSAIRPKRIADRLRQEISRCSCGDQRPAAGQIFITDVRSIVNWLTPTLCIGSGGSERSKEILAGLAQPVDFSVYWRHGRTAQLALASTGIRLRNRRTTSRKCWRICV
jgi:hypothetical protein